MDINLLIFIAVIAFIVWNTSRNVKNLKGAADRPLGQAFGLGLKKWLK